MMVTTITVHIVEGMPPWQWFFTTDHCQPGLPENHVPTTYFGKTRDMVAAEEEGEGIPNPDPKYQG